MIYLADGPKTSIVLMTPSGMIVEGDSVNLTCSTDANPAAKHTWYKENQPLLASPVSIYHFTAISSEDSGNYSCKSENQYGQITSNSLFIDVKCKKNSIFHFKYLYLCTNVYAYLSIYLDGWMDK